MSGPAHSWYKWMLAALKECKQSTTVVEYQHRSEEITTKAIGLSEEWLISFFTARLKDSLRYELLLAQPTTYYEVVSLTNYTQVLWVPNVVVAHQKEGVEALHLASGRTICKLHLQEGGLHADINGDGVLDHVQAVGGNGAEQTVVSGSMEVLRPCWAVATSGVPIRDQLFNLSICHYTHFNLFKHGELYRSYSRGSDIASLEVATPILIPRSDGHRHRKGSHGDATFLTNRREITPYSPDLHGHGAIWQWQRSTSVTWSNLPFPSGMIEGGLLANKKP